LRFVLHLLGAIALALAIGFGASLYALSEGRVLGAVRIGPWAAWPQVGSPNPDPYARAYLARRGALQLGLGEGLRFVASTDDTGTILDRSCSYRVEGATPLAAFWTLAAITPDGISVVPAGAPIALRSNQPSRNAEGEFALRISPAMAAGNWLEVAGEGPMQFILTLYDTSIFSGLGSSQQTLPAVIREHCS